LADLFDIAPIRAKSLPATGMMKVAAGDAAGAVDDLRGAVAAWQHLDAPWDAARSRRLLAEALARPGAPDPAHRQFGTDRRGLAELGAVPEIRQVDAALAGLGDETPGEATDAPRRAVRTFVFTDIVGSTRLAASVGDEAWDRALRWHDRTIRSVVAEHGGEEV